MCACRGRAWRDDRNCGRADHRRCSGFRQSGEPDDRRCGCGSALCSLAIPNEEFGAPFRLLKFGFILIGGWLGIFGMVLGTFLLAGHLAGLTSFGIPYLMPFVGKGLAGYHAPRIPYGGPPLHQMRERPVFTKRDQRVRLRKNRKAAEPEEKQERGE